MPTTYRNFDLLITPIGQGPAAGPLPDPGQRYNARVIGSPVGESRPVSFALPFVETELRGFFWLSGRVQRAMRPRPAAEAAPLLDPRAFGVRLFETVFAGEVGTLFQRSLDVVEREQQGLRIRLRLREVPELADLPWEYLYAPGLNRFPALSSRTPLVRYVEMARPQEILQIESPLTILTVIANPGGDAAALDVEGEWARLHGTLAPLQEAGLVRLERLATATVPALQQRLYRDPVHVLHFIGHGRFDPETNRGGLLFAAEEGGGRLVEAGTLAMHLHDHDPLRLVFLNACEGARGGRRDPFAGVAQQLVEQGIPAVLAMQFEVSDRAAIALAHEFYRALAAGLPVDTATSEARKAVRSAGNTLEWGTPVLFTRSDDNRLLLFKPQGGEAPTEARGVQTDTGGGAYVGSSVDTGGGAFIGRDVTYVGYSAEDVARIVDRTVDRILNRQVEKPPAEMAAVIETKAFEPETVLVPAGPFRMGSDPGAGIPDHETPQHEVELPAYRIGKTPVTNAQYAWFLKRVKGQEEPRRAGWFLREPPGDKLDQPVVGVSWHDAMAYCRWLSEETGRSYRLPTEAEWEKACRGTAGQVYPWGKDWADGCCSVNTEDTLPVGTHPAGASPYGCLDMLGNVEEWTCSLWGRHPQRPEFGYPYEPGEEREIYKPTDLPVQVRIVHRGGSHRSSPDDLRATARKSALADSCITWRGFRISMQIKNTATTSTNTGG